MVITFTISTAFFLLTTFFTREKTGSQTQVSNFEKVDTLQLNRNLRTAAGLKNTNRDSACFYYKKALEDANDLISEDEYSDGELDRIKYQKAQALQGIGLYYAKNFSLDTALEYYSRELKIYEQLAANEKESHRKEKYQTAMAKSMLTIGATYFDMGNNIQSSEYYNRSLKTGRLLNDSIIQSRALLNLGMVYNNEGRYDEAINNYFTAIKIFEHLKDKKGIAISYMSIGNILRKQNTLNKAIENYENALQIFKEMEDERGQSSCYNNLGIAYGNKKEYDRALFYYGRALEINSKNGNTAGMANIYSNMAVLYQYIKDFDMAIYYVREALGMNRKRRAAVPLMGSYINMGSAYLTKIEDSLQLKNHHPEFLDTIIIYTEKGLSLADSLSSVTGQTSAIAILRKAYSLQKNYKKAYEMANELIVLNDSVYNTEKTKIIADAESRYEAEKKEQQIKQQEQELQKQQLKLSNARVFQNFFISIIVSLIVVVLFSYYYYKQKHKANRILDEKNSLIEKQKQEVVKQKEELQKTNQKLTELIRFKEKMTGMIVHDLKNPLNNILNSNEIDDDEFREQLVKQSGYDMLNLIQNILDVYKLEEAKMNVEPELLNIPEILKACTSELALYITEKDLELNYSEHETPVVTADKNLIKRIFSNLMSNAVKYGAVGSSISIKSKVVNQTEIRFSIENQGPTIPQEKQSIIFESYNQHESRAIGRASSTGLGLSFCKMAVELHGGKIGVNSNEQRTEFWFTLPSRGVNTELTD